MRWIIVANRADARFFQDDRKRGLKEIESLQCPEARDKTLDINTDDGGRSFDSHGQGSHRMEPKTPVQDTIATRFAGRVAAELEVCREKHQFTQLTLVAPADFLGILRPALSSSCRQLVSEEHSKNLVNENPDGIATLLDKARG